MARSHSPVPALSQNPVDAATIACEAGAWWPSCFSRNGAQGTSRKPRPLSIMAKRPEASVKRRRYLPAAYSSAAVIERLACLTGEALIEGFDLAPLQRADQVPRKDETVRAPRAAP